MSTTLDPHIARRLLAAYDEVEDTPGVFVLGLVRRAQDWVATVALDDVRDENQIHADDPSLFSWADDDGPTALRMALARAKKAMSL
jgi:hypothetical protein